MYVQSKKLQTRDFKDIEGGTVFRINNELFMKVFLDDDYIACPRCDEDIYAGRELGGIAVHLKSGDINKIGDWECVEIVTGSFVEE